MKTLIALCFLFTFMQLSIQKAQIDPPCTADMDGVKEHVNHCLHITCKDGKPRPVACMNDSCPGGKQSKMDRMPDDNTKTYPACCGQLVCE